ncbi:4-hydroxythreonine-4-phosphate dehydrogenase PdxA [Cyanobium sp. HWJ4-Hawea]|uniref:4-hydroxythreonine-4-phosphate dehydrogenase PdxA n=1 Tax=Cyanobium sp. HWJ4-Hawea TaxID=2823713 RepID=UPI0020CF1AC5|nr:4-hydroxythreonine-4-phosphate dehydrogenase PdxA [Cyanobium sp. HWJ4-Hawea]MCP9808091.1 4-hydroxythreonine-4-phosphate dehydrogenase PdxA [Cyanobium sp. HWJ4-Hawea]
MGKSLSQAPSNPKQRRLAIALGDPAGIGAEVTLKALAQGAASEQPPLLVGCRRWLEGQYEMLRQISPEPLVDPAQLEMLDLPLTEPVKPGQGTTASGHDSFLWLTAATQVVQKGQCQALVTAPICKASWHAAGHRYPGQTERLAELAGCAHASMLFTAKAPGGHWRMNTLLATTHIPLAEVPRQLNGELVQAKLDLLNGFCRRFTARPHLLVAGLNPHAGEGGQLGLEESEWLEASLASWQRAHPEVRLEGPLPPDTCWLGAAEAWRSSAPGPNGYLALYHDQGLIPVKLLAFDAAVNTTLGLPFLRTSPDHGTGFGIAGMGAARALSMAAAIETAGELSRA